MLEQGISNKAGWTRVAFGDVVRKVSDKVDPWESGLERYVAGDHMDTDDLRIRRWGLIGDDYLGPAFHMRFKPGHVLYGSRRTYLRKVALADFEGITANTTYVLETKDPNVLMPELLPFIMQTEAFHAHSIARSKGSVNPYVNFSDIACFEFSLPPLQEQARLTEILAASRSHVDGLRLLQSEIDTAIDAVIVDALEIRGIGSLERYKGSFPTARGETVYTPVSGNGEPVGSDNGGGMYFKVADFNRNSDHRWMQTSAMQFQREANPSIRILEPGTVVFPKRGASIFLNKIGILGSEAALDPNLMALVPDTTRVSGQFLMWFFRGVGLWRFADTTSVPQLNHKHLKPVRVPLPSLDEQIALCARVDSLSSMLADCGNRLEKAQAVHRLVSEAAFNLAGASE
jgi:type I restriction modification DNA specificity protein